MSTIDSNTNDRETLIKATRQLTSRDSKSDGQTSLNKLYQEFLFALSSSDLLAVTIRVKKLTLDQRLSLNSMLWGNLKLLEVLLSWAEFLDVTLDDHNTNHKLPTPKEVVQAVVVLMNRGAYLIPQKFVPDQEPNR